MEIRQALTFDDVLLLPAASSVLPTETDTHTRLTREVTLGIPQNRECTGDRLGKREAARERQEELHAQRNAMALFDLRRQRGKMRAVGFAARHARYLGAEGEMRVTARRHFG